jgi:hypothetical protein
MFTIGIILIILLLACWSKLDDISNQLWRIEHKDEFRVMPVEKPEHVAWFAAMDAKRLAEKAAARQA